MIATENRKRLCAALLIVNLAFIWGNSMLPGGVSGNFSRWVGELLQKLLSLPVTESPEGHHLLRKLGHFSEFACLGMLLTWRAGMASRERLGNPLGLWFPGLAAACVDETIQAFVAGRNSSLLDVWIDAAGVAAGIGLLLVGYHLLRRKREKG